MKKSFKFFIYVVVLLASAATMFYFWASASTLPEAEYSKIIETSIDPTLDQDSIFKIMTYNLGYLSGMTNNKAVKRDKSMFDLNLDVLEQKLKMVNADIIAFQEIDFDADRSFNVNQLDAVAQMGYPYAAQVVNWDERYLPFPYGWPSNHFGKVVSGQSVMSKYEIIEQQRVVLQRVESSPFYRDAFYLERLAQIVKMKVQDHIIVIINVHLEAFDQPTRIAQAETVLNLYTSYKEDFPTILLGDFNSDPANQNSIIHKFLELADTGNAAFSSNRYENTFSSEDPISRIDYIFFNTKFIEYIDGRVLDSFGEISDHLPVEMEFKFLDEPSQ